MKKSKGFTLAELLIVVAIIAVLVAISVPIFTTQLEKSREAVDIANVRSAYAEAVAEYLGNGGQSAVSKTAAVTQKTSSWEMGADQAVLHTRTNGSEGTVSITGKSTGSYSVTVNSNGTISIS